MDLSPTTTHRWVHLNSTEQTCLYEFKCACQSQSHMSCRTLNCDYFPFRGVTHFQMQQVDGRKRSNNTHTVHTKFDLWFMSTSVIRYSKRARFKIVRNWIRFHWFHIKFITYIAVITLIAIIQLTKFVVFTKMLKFNAHWTI